MKTALATRDILSLWLSRTFAINPSGCAMQAVPFGGGAKTGLDHPLARRRQRLAAELRGGVEGRVEGDAQIDRPRQQDLPQMWPELHVAVPCDFRHGAAANREPGMAQRLD